MLVRKKRISIDGMVDEWVNRSMDDLKLRPTPVTVGIALRSESMDLRQTDPADRLIAATAHELDLTLVTSDQRLLDCPTIKVLRLKLLS